MNRKTWAWLIVALLAASWAYGFGFGTGGGGGITSGQRTFINNSSALMKKANPTFTGSLTGPGVLIDTGGDGSYGQITGNNTTSFTLCDGISGAYGPNTLGGVPYWCLNGTNTAIPYLVGGKIPSSMITSTGGGSSSFWSRQVSVFSNVSSGRNYEATSSFFPKYTMPAAAADLHGRFFTTYSSARLKGYDGSTQFYSVNEGTLFTAGYSVHLPKNGVYEAIAFAANNIWRIIRHGGAAISQAIAEFVASLSNNKASVDYGAPTIGSPAYANISSTNTGNASASGCSQTLSGDRAYSIDSGNCGATLAIGAGCYERIKFDPYSTAARTSTYSNTCTGISAASTSLTGMGTSACSSGTYTGGVDWATWTTNGASTQPTSANVKGNSFQVTSNGTLYSIVLPNDAISSGNTLTCRVSASPDLGSGYLGEASIATGAGDKELIFTNHPALTAGTQYYFGCVTATDSPAEYLSFTANQTTEAYSNGSVYTHTGGGFAGGAMTANTSLDLRFGVKLCQ